MIKIAAVAEPAAKRPKNSPAGFGGVRKPMPHNFTLPTDALDDTLRLASLAWHMLRDSRILLTGGTGFFGRWLAESFAFANQTLSLNSSLTVVARHEPAHSMPPGVQFRCAHVTTIAPNFGAYDYILHAAATASSNPSPAEATATIVDGTRRIVELAAVCEPRGVLLVSTGAVYGPNTPLHVAEDDIAAVDPATLTVYGAAKLAAEQIALTGSRTHGVPLSIARCFTFCGPGLPLDAHFAVGNFIRDGLAGRPIRVSGDGTAIRSYMDAADLAVWLWTILAHGANGRAYNVGSPHPVSIGDLARTVAAQFSTPPHVAIAENPVASPAPVYVPSTARAETELGLTCSVSLPVSIARTIAWHRELREE